jgi:excisionase family DNA binding protein
MTNTTMPPPYTPATLANRWDCSTTLVYDLLASGNLSSFRLGRLWRIPAAAVEEYECRTQTATGASSAPDAATPASDPAAVPGTMKSKDITRIIRQMR